MIGREVSAEGVKEKINSTILSKSSLLDIQRLFFLQTSYLFFVTLF